MKEEDMRAEVIVKAVKGADRGRTYSDLPRAVDSLLRAGTKGHKGFEVAYFVYSGCSSCIGELLDFLDVIERTGLELPVIIVPSSRHDQPTIEYYVEQTGVTPSSDMTIIKPMLPVSELKELNGRVVILYDGIPVNGFYFANR
ncbi:hypothetical protein [uncultured Rikenella sp.]|uniref:hypothetical protein n=1 Tax=uncultured Rikenella sp. TaxID=368003 RepID=UPI00260EE5A3|nr:hypothetical protein [uncultured Rikenella sp.]